MKHPSAATPRALLAALLLPSGLFGQGGEPSGLRVLEPNPRYFEHRGKPVALFGSGLWTIIPDASVDIATHNAWYADRGSNANRATLFAFCVQEGVDHLLAPWQRTGPGQARDGKPRFDLTRWDPAFWERMHAYFSDCQERGIFVLLQIFDEPYVEGAPERWGMHPFNPENNVNDIPDMPGGAASGEQAFYSPGNAKLMQLQDALVRRLLDVTASRYDNLIYEIGNEINMDSEAKQATEWQRHWIDFFAAYEEEHPGLSLILTNDTRPSLLAAAPEAWGAINNHGSIHQNLSRLPTVEIVDLLSEAVGRDFEAYERPILNSRPCSDPDRTNYPDVASEDQGRATFLTYLFNGGHVIGFRTTEESWRGGEAAERTAAACHAVLGRIPFSEMAPRHDLVEGDHSLCLAKEGGPAAVYLPLGGSVRVTVAGASADAQWVARLFDPRRREWGEQLQLSGAELQFEAPTAGEGQDWVLVIDAAD